MAPTNDQSIRQSESRNDPQGVALLRQGFGRPVNPGGHCGIHWRLMTYSEKLKDPRWQKKRLEVLEAHGWACFDCEAKDKTLHVHHPYYVRGKEYWDYPTEFLVALCETCHNKRHAAWEQFEGLVLDKTVGSDEIKQLISGIAAFYWLTPKELFPLISKILMVCGANGKLAIAIADLATHKSVIFPESEREQ